MSINDDNSMKTVYIMIVCYSNRLVVARVYTYKYRVTVID